MYKADETRYESMEYRRCGQSGLMLPVISLGFWQNFGVEYPLEHQREIVLAAFDAGITHFDLANNYGMPHVGLAEQNFGKILASDLKPYRDEMVIATKAGYDCWPGPYGNWGSRKYLMASLDRSLLHMGLDYVDIFYHHRFDPDTPLEETCRALSDIVKQGKALYIGFSNYDDLQMRRAAKLLREYGSPCLIEQPCYNMLERSAEKGLLQTLKAEGIGCVAYCPLSQGALTDRYLKGIPEGSRAARKNTSFLSEEELKVVRRLHDMAQKRGESLATMALAWILRREEMTSVIIGASSVEQLKKNVKAVKSPAFTQEELAAIDALTL